MTKNFSAAGMLQKDGGENFETTENFPFWRAKGRGLTRDIIVEVKENRVRRNEGKLAFYLTRVFFMSRTWCLSTYELVTVGYSAIFVASKSKKKKKKKTNRKLDTSF